MNGHMAIFSTDNGPAIVTGLNLLVAISKHPLARPAFIDVLKRGEQESGAPAKDLLECLNAAVAWNQEINRMITEDLGIEPQRSQEAP